MIKCSRTALTISCITVAIVVLSATALGLAASSPAAYAATPSANSGLLLGVSCTSSSFCMAVGTSTGTTLTESWNGTVWSVLPSPNPSSIADSLTSVSCPSPTDCVAVGNSYNTASTYQDLVESWDGTTWSVMSAPVFAGDNSSFNSVSCTTSTYCVAVGYTQASSGVDPLFMPLLESWNGTSWSVDSTPSPEYNSTFFRSVSCASSTSCMAVGQTTECVPVMGSSVCFTGQMLVESWDGANWSIDTTPNENATDELFGVSCTSPTSCVGMGTYYNNSTGVTRALVESWNGTTWSVIYNLSLSVGSGAGNVSCLSLTDCMGVGQSANQTLALSWNGTVLSVVPSANPSTTSDGLNGVSCLSPTRCFAVGSTQSPDNTFQTLIETWNGTDWSVAPTTSVLVPSARTALSGTSAVLDASASAAAGVTTVQFVLTGGSYTQSVIGTAVPTIYGYVFVWNTTGVPGGIYTLQSLVTDAAGNTAYSPGITITVDNTPPTTAVLIPSNGAHLRGTVVLDASASASFGVQITKVQFVLTGRSFNKTVIGTATATLFGWVFMGNTTLVHNGTYTLQSLATDAAGNTAYSQGISIKVAN
jgi:hypothetical protein